MASESASLDVVAADAERHVDGSSELREWVTELFAEQRAVIRRDLLDSYEAIASRVAEQIAPEGDGDERDLPPGRVGMPVVLALAALSLVTLAFAWLYWRAETNWQQSEALVAELNAERRALREQVAGGTIAEQTSETNARRAEAERYSQALDLVAWSFNAANRYGWGATPLDDTLATRLGELATRLEALGYSGAIVVENACR